MPEMDMERIEQAVARFGAEADKVFFEEALKLLALARALPVTDYKSSLSRGLENFLEDWTLTFTHKMDTADAEAEPDPDEARQKAQDDEAHYQHFNRDPEDP